MATVTPIGPGVYRVDAGDRQEIVYVAGRSGERWAFWQGRTFRISGQARTARAARPAGSGHAQTLVAPMPATIVKVLVAAGQAVAKGQTLVVAEAMKMELPIRAPADGVVAEVLCREGELVQADQRLVELS
jgi:biotin carboxyl carrier protein